MNLKKYDNKCVQITYVDGKTYEGMCQYNCNEYCFHEFGVDEECLEMLCTLFYKSGIKKIVSLEKHHGPYGKFTEKYGELEKSIIESGNDMIEEAFESEEQVVLLIDEIDKADLEFPNDLLWELDQMEFYIYETKRTVKAKVRPIVIITSNAEKELPDAFLRRCIFHYIDFPDRELMEEIVKTHIPDIEENLLKNAMDTFYEIRTYSQLRKKPATSELIDWLNALMIGGIDPDIIRRELPFVGVLIKKDEDLEVLRKRVE